MTLSRPLFSIVSAVYDVERYLPDFIASIEGQRFDLGRVEVIAVDDGSTDGSRAILEAWARRRPGLVKVLAQPNHGQGSARNVGLEHASGEWVTFTDPDDMLDRDFFRVAHRFAMAHPGVEVLAGKPMLLEEAKGWVSDTHARARQYEAGNRCVDLDKEPETFPGVSAGSILKLDRISDVGLRFDPRIRPNFEDGHLVARFLLSLPKPVVGILRDAKYIYRKRAARDSTSQRAMDDPGRYSHVLQFGYLDILSRARTRHGFVPAWVQQLVVYELSWYLTASEDHSTEIRLSPEMILTFHDLLGQVLGQLEPEVIRGRTARPMKSIWTDILAYACRPQDWHSPTVARTKVDRQMGLQRVSYRYRGTPPREELLVNGAATQPAHAKTMSHIYYGRTLMHERIIWLPAAGALRVLLDGVPAMIVNGRPEPRREARPSTLRELLWVSWRLPRTVLVETGLRRVRRSLAKLSAPALRLIARGGPFRSWSGDAWILMDRLDDADDSAERLFEFLLAERPDIDAWFTIEKGTHDWERMRAAGVPRLVAYGSFRWKMLMLNCSWLLSSHADLAITEPSQMTDILGRPTWRYGFLQHGVIKDDLSQWLNNRDIDLFVVSTQAELDSITADGTTYVSTTKETRNTGLPRFDRLLAKGREIGTDDRDLVIVAPTWRTYLNLPIDPVTKRRAVDDAFWDSDYLRRWTALLGASEIADAVARRGWRIAFMPHPNLQQALPQMQLPAYVEPLTFAGNDVQGLYARCALLVTDYSSVAFNAAYLDRPVVYYQFDLERVMSGAHLGRQGYFDYDRDGFGPVVTDATQAVAAVVAAIERGTGPTPEYQARIDATFVDRDGHACARVVAAVEELSRPYVPPLATSSS